MVSTHSMLLRRRTKVPSFLHLSTDSLNAMVEKRSVERKWLKKDPLNIMMGEKIR